jgi:dynein regulatry complex protein 1
VTFIVTLISSRLTAQRLGGLTWPVCGAMAETDKETRIAARRNAREARAQRGECGLAVLRGGGSILCAVSAEASASSGEGSSLPANAIAVSRGNGGSRVGAAKVSESLSLLDGLKSRTIEHVTSVRLQADEREADRRREEEERRQDRLWRLHEEADESGKANAAIEMHWEDLNEFNMPQELFKEMQLQRKACEAVIASKDSLIREFQAELRAKDEEYVKALQQQREDVEEVLRRMDVQYKELHSQYEAELSAVETAFEQERAELLTRQREESDALFRQREDAEQRFTKERLDAEKRFAEELDRVQSSDAEDYLRLKVKLETDAQTLQQQLAVMKAVYLLNTEKLEYNYRWLTERENDNEATSKAHRAKVKRLETALAKVRAEYLEADRRHRTRNSTLTSEFARITKQFQELQFKAGYFSSSDEAKFHQVWDLHESETDVLIDRLLSADRIISEQVLGWKPSGEPVRPERPSLAKTAATTTSTPDTDTKTDGPSSSGGLSSQVMEACDCLEHGDEDLDAEAARLEATLRRNDDEDEGEEDVGPKEEGEDDGGPKEEVASEEAAVQRVIVIERTRRSRRRYRATLGAIIEEASFMVADDHRDRSPSETAAAILWQVGVRSLDDLEDIVEVLAGPADVDLSDAKPAVSPREGEEDDGLEALAVGSNANGLCVPTDAIVGHLRRWADEHSSRRQEDARATRSESDTASSSNAAASTLSSEEVAYWKDLSDMVPAKKVRVWKSLESGLKRYLEVLKRRGEMMDEVETLREQNQELRKVLAGYLRADVNRELLYPPGSTTLFTG